MLRTLVADQNAVAFDEGLIYGKLARGAHTAYVNCDATIALPIIVTALSQTAAKYMKGRKRPNFTSPRTDSRSALVCHAFD